MKLNWTELKKDIAEVTAEILTLKKYKRESGQPNWNTFKSTPEGLCLNDDQLRRSKDAATRLCAIAAQARGHVHFHNMDLETQGIYVADMIKTYLLKEAA